MKRPCNPRLGTLLAALWLTGCAIGEPLPESITKAPAGNVQLVEVLRNVPAAVAAETRVRWGGSVVELADEGAGVTRIEVLERKLDVGGRPLYYGPSDGRFVVRAAPDVDPWRYRIGSEITVAGAVEGAVQTSNGELAPVVRVRDFVRWRPPAPIYRPYPWYYDDPLWGPGPWYRNRWYPYRGRARFGAGFGY